MEERHGGSPWRRHGCAMSWNNAMGKNVSILMLRKLFHKGRHASAMGKKILYNVEKKNCMWHAMVECHAGAMPTPCGKKNHSNVEEKPSHEGRHGSAMSAP